MIPVIRTKRLIVNGFDIDDALRVKELITKRIAQTTLPIPYPFKLIYAQRWIASHLTEYLDNRGITAAIRLKESNELIGAIGVSLNGVHRRGEIGYWIGESYWNNGYCTEAVRAVMHYCFRTLKLNKVYAGHFATNPASGRVMVKCGMKLEGRRRQHCLKWGKYFDVVEYAILRSEYRRTR